MRTLIALLTLVVALAGSVAIGQPVEEGNANEVTPTTMSPAPTPTPLTQPPEIDVLMTAIYLLFGVVLIGMPLYSIAIRKWANDGTTTVGLRALSLPNGSIRAMLGLLTVGSFVLVLVYGLSVPASSPFFSQIITAFGTLAGSVTGFYFGGRVAAPPPK